MRDILFRGFTPDENGKDKAFVNGEWIKGQWVQGNYWKLNKTTYCFKEDYERDPNNTEHYIVFDQMTDWGLPNRHLQADVIPETVGQYTGLTDKNGKKIFEGDILKQKTTPEFAKVNSFEWERYGVVRFGYYDWDEGEAGCASMGWYIKPLKSVSIKPKNYLVGHIQAGLNQCDILNKYYPMEVIGNIHDNPELLEGGEG